MHACTDPHTGGASPQGFMGPLPMRRSQRPSRSGPHSRLGLVCACARFLRVQGVRMPHVSGMCNQGVYASKASPSSVLIIWDRLLLVLAKQLQAAQNTRYAHFSAETDILISRRKRCCNQHCQKNMHRNYSAVSAEICAGTVPLNLFELRYLQCRPAEYMLIKRCSVHDILVFIT